VAEAFAERNRELAEHLGDVALRRDAAGFVAHITSTGCRTLGFDAADVIGSKFDELVHPEDREHVLPKLWTTLESSERAHATLRLRCGNGEWLRIDATVMRYDGDSVVLFGRDVTERHRVDEALRLRESQFLVVADSVPAMLWMTDACGNVLFVNRAVTDFAGEMSERTRDGWIDRYVHPADRHRVWSAIDAAVSSCGPFSVEARVTDRDGSYHWLHMKGEPRFGPGGEFRGHVGASFDVTATKQAELSVHRSERLASLGNLATGIAHEISDPLTAIRSAAEVGLQSQQRCGSSPAVEQSLRRILANAERATRITRELLRFARTDPGTPEPQDLNQLVREVVERLRGNIRAAQASVDWELDPKLPLAPLRRSEMIYALTNLLQNAVESSERPVHVLVRTEARDEQVFLLVVDDGDGIPEEALTQVFDPFFTTRRRKGGTGLGLSLVQRIVSDHGGSIEVQSTLDRGTSFIIALPSQPA
jgi:two-component system NtrC family sensor kinase